MKMTSQAIKAEIIRASAQKRRIEVPDDDCPGLNLGISPRGVCTWSVRVRDTTGRLRRFPVGKFETLGIAAARKAARELRVRVEGGADPIREKRERRQTGANLRAGIGTLGALLDLYETEKKPSKTWYTGAGRKRIERVFSSLLTASVADMLPATIHRTADAYGTQSAAQNAIRALSPVLNWAVRRAYAPAALGLTTPEAGIPPRVRILNDDELRRILPVLRRWPTAHGPAMLMMLLTLTRCGEVTGLKWSEVDLDKKTWTLPPHRQKNTKLGTNRLAMVIPLSDQAVNLLRSMLLRQHPEPDPLIFCSKKGTALANWDRVQKSIFKKSKTSGWHRHDLRRTGATALGNANAPSYVVEAALNHQKGPYNHSSYEKDVRKAFTAWGHQLRRLTARDGKELNAWGEGVEATVYDL